MKKGKRQLTEIQVERKMAVITTLKSLIFPVVLCLVVAVGIYLIVHYVNPDTVEDQIIPRAYGGDDKPIVLENDKLKLELDPITTNFTILQKDTGKVWSSIADNAADDSTALKDEKGKMLSNLVLSYAVTNGLETIYNCHDYSVVKGVYEIEADENQIKLLYSIGNISKEFIIPPVIKETDFEALKAKMEQSEVNYVKDYYTKYDINNLRKKDNKEELLELYPVLATDVIYVLRADKTPDARKQKMEGFFENAGYTYDMYLADKELDGAESSDEKPVFNLEMDLRLDGNDLVVEIPYSSFEYKSTTPIYTITPLPYFGAADKNTNDGFILVPEGGGSIIKYNNGKFSQNPYYANMYGWDMCLSRDFVVHNTRNYFNVFGQSCENSSYICIMEGCAPYASVQAGVSGMVSDYNYVNAVYSICQREDYKVSTMANAAVYAYLPELPDESIIQRYRFIDSNDYVDMAYAYRDYLENEYGQYMSLNTDNEAPLAVEIVGAIDKVQQIVGVPVSVPIKLTSYKEAANLITDIKNSGVNNLSVKYTGWCNGGVSQKVLKSINLIAALGSSKDMKNLSSTAKNLGVDLYLDGITQYAHRSTIFNGFNSFTDAARLLTKQRAELYHFSHITYSSREGFKSYYLLKAPIAMKMADNLVDYAVKYGTGVSFQDIGEDLSADYYRKERYSREQVMHLNEDLLKTLDDKGAKLMINMGNDYAVPFADVVTNMDLKGSGYTVIDEEIPFYQIAIHGYVNYTGDPINICGNDQEELLKCVEYGAGLNFTIMNASSFALQKSLYPEYYGCEYAEWKDRMIGMYTRFNNELGHIFNQEMTGHENLTPYVSVTTYADGTKAYVNYSYADDYTAPDGTLVPVRDYVVVR